MKNREFHAQLRALGWTVTRLAVALHLNRARLGDALNNTPGHGGHTRRKVIRFFQAEMPEQAEALVRALGWGESREQKAESRNGESGNADVDTQGLVENEGGNVPRGAGAKAESGKRKAEIAETQELKKPFRAIWWREVDGEWVATEVCLA